MKEQLPLDKRIEQAAKSYANQFKYGVEYREPAFVDGAAYCLEKLQAAEKKAARYEKALKDFSRQIKMHCNKMGIRSVVIQCIANRMEELDITEALTPKTGVDERRL